MPVHDEQYYIDNGWKPGIIGNKYSWVRKPTDADAGVGRYRDIKTNKVTSTLPTNHTIVGPLMSAQSRLKFSGEQRTPEKYEYYQKLQGEDPDYQGPTLDEVVVNGVYTGKNKNPQNINPDEVQTWDDRQLLKDQLSLYNNQMEQKLAETYSRNFDEQYRLKGWEGQLVDGYDNFGNPRKEYRFVNPKTGEIGPMVSRWWLEDRGLDTSAGAFARYNSLANTQMINQWKNQDNTLIKKATRNIEGPSSYDLANAVLGGALNLMSPTNDIGGIVGGFRKNQSFMGAAHNTLFGVDPIEPEKSGNYGLLELNNKTANWASKHPYITSGINTIGDSAILGGLSKAASGGLGGEFFRGGLKGSTAATKIGRGINYTLGSPGNWTNKIRNFSTNFTNKVGSKAVRTLGHVPGGSSVTSGGKGVLNWGKSTLGNIKGYGNQAFQWIPEGTRVWTSNALTNTKNFLGKFKPVNLLNQGLKRTTGYYLTPNAKTGFKTLGTMYGLGQTGYNLFTGEDVDVTKFGELLKYTPGLTFLDKPYSWYNKANNGIDTYNNIKDMYDYGVTPEGLYDTGQGFAGVLGE